MDRQFPHKNTWIRFIDQTRANDIVSKRQTLFRNLNSFSLRRRNGRSGGTRDTAMGDRGLRAKLERFGSRKCRYEEVNSHIPSSLRYKSRCEKSTILPFSWLEFHKKLALLNQQSVLEITGLREESVLEWFISLKKVYN